MTIKLDFLEIIALQAIARKDVKLADSTAVCEMLKQAGLLILYMKRDCNNDYGLHYRITTLGKEVLKAHLPYGEFNSHIHNMANANLRLSKNKEMEEQYCIALASEKNPKEEK
jgi:hypothetical protein